MRGQRYSRQKSGGGFGSQGWPSPFTRHSQRIQLHSVYYASEEIERREEAAIENGCSDPVDATAVKAEDEGIKVQQQQQQYNVPEAGM